MDPTPRREHARTLLREMVTGGEGAVVLDVACLLICQLAGRDIDVPTELAALDELASTVGSRSFEGVMTALFAGPEPMRGNTEAYYAVANSMISDVRRTRRGLPITLSVIAMEVGRRSGVAIAGVGMPGHFLVGDGTGAERFADPFSGARVFDADGAKAIFHTMTGGRAPWNDAFLRPTSNLDIVFRILANIKAAASRHMAERQQLPWVLDALSWFPQGEPFDPAAASRAVAPLN